MFFALQILLPTIFTPSTSSFVFLVLLIIKSRYEGIRINIFLYIIAQAGLMFFSHPIAKITFALLAYWALSYFPIFEFPETKGPFLVGFKHLYLPKDIQISVFYPTLEKTEKVRYKTMDDGWVRIYDIMRSYPNHFIPKLVYKLAFGFLEHLDIGANLDAKIIPPQHLSNEDQKFPAIIFSHGLSANRNLYTGFARQWASYGYIVFCIDHAEQVYVEFKGWEDYRMKRSEHLVERCDVISTVLDFIEDAKGVKKFFRDSEVEVDLRKVSLAGHSFGSAACAQAAGQDKRVTGALVLLDPWLFPTSDEVLETPAKRPVLILRSESFANVFEEFKVKEKIKKYIDANKEYMDQTISCYFQDTTHNSFCDFIIHMPREMQLFGIVKSPHQVEEVYNSQTMLTQIFLDLSLYSKVMYDIETKKTLVLKAFENYQAKNSAKSQLEIDPF